jgi:hypothetical protein
MGWMLPEEKTEEEAEEETRGENVFFASSPTFT